MRRTVWAAVMVAALGGCVIQRLMTRKLTGTCDGACAHYVECKPGHHDVDRERCISECPNVMVDSDSLMEFESMTCRNALEYVDGVAPRAAQSKPTT